MEALEQALHALWAFATLAALAAPWSARARGALSGLILALPRELVDQWPIERPLDTMLDLAFFMLGGALAAAYFTRKETR